MVYITGDTHGIRDIGKLLGDRLRHLTKNDYVIVCGDCGVLFDPKDKEAMLNLYSYLPFTVLFADGNHENFPLLASYPQEIWHGGKVHRLTDSVFHLMRGQVFELEGETYFVFGGARSFDKERRKEGVSWWPQEMPTEDEYREGVKNLAAVSNKVDYVISHDCPAGLLKEIAKYSDQIQQSGVNASASNGYLEAFAKSVDFRHWFFGHYHCDVTLGKYDCVFDRVTDAKDPERAAPPTVGERQRAAANEEEHCPNCHHHCHRDSLRCNRGRMYFAAEKTDGGAGAPRDKLLSALSDLKRKYEKSARKNQALQGLSDCEKNILIELLRKMETLL